MHLILDGYGRARDLLNDEKVIYDFLDGYPAKIGMTKISLPYVTYYKQGKPEDWGISGFVLIAESHITIHTFTETGAVHIDIYSCKNFNAEKIIEDLTQRFKLVRTRIHLINREMEIAKVPLEVASDS